MKFEFKPSFDRSVKLFNPDDSTLKMVEELRKQAPLPLLELLLEMRKEK